MGTFETGWRSREDSNLQQTVMSETPSLGRAEPPSCGLSRDLYRSECELADSGHDAGGADHISEPVRGAKVAGNGADLGSLEAASVGAGCNAPVSV